MEPVAGTALSVCPRVAGPTSRWTERKAGSIYEAIMAYERGEKVKDIALNWQTSERNVYRNVESPRKTAPYFLPPGISKREVAVYAAANDAISYISHIRKVTFESFSGCKTPTMP